MFNLLGIYSDNSNNIAQVNKLKVQQMLTTSPDNVEPGYVSLQYADAELEADQYITNLVFNAEFSKYLNEFKDVAGSNSFVVKITNLTKETTLLGTVINIANTEVKITIATDDEKSFTTQEIDVDDVLIVELDFDRKNQFIDPVVYGATPDGSTNSTNAFNQAFTVASSTGLTVKPTPGIYWVSQASVPSNVNIDLENVEIHNPTDPSGQIVNTFEAKGVKTDITANVAVVPIWGSSIDNQDAFYVEVDDASVFAVGDDVLFERDTDSNALDHIDFNKIESINGNVIKMERIVMVHPWEIGTPITKINLVENVEIKNGYFTGLQSATNGVYPSGGGAGLYFEYAKGITVTGVSGTKMMQTIRTSYVYNIFVDKVRCYDNRLFGMWYAKTIGLSLSSFLAEGNGQGGLILGSVKQSKVSHFNIHNNGRLNGSGDNIQVGRADGLGIYNGDLYRSECYGVWILNHSENVTVTGVNIQDGSTGGINITNGSKYINITGNTILNNIGSGILVGDAVGDAVSNITVSNNKIEKSTGNWSFIAQNCDYLKFTDNDIMHVGVNKVFIASNCTNIKTGNNLINGAITHSGTETAETFYGSVTVNKDFTTKGYSNFQTSGSNQLQWSSLQTGSVQIASASSTPIASIIGRQTAITSGLVIGAATHNSNTSGDLVLTVRENNNSDFATLTNSAIRITRYTTLLLDILRNGNVGLGVTGPSEKLEVAGKTKSNSIILQSPDGNYHEYKPDNAGNLVLVV